jgi:hypothetical protein
MQLFSPVFSFNWLALTQQRAERQNSEDMRWNIWAFSSLFSGIYFFDLATQEISGN